MTDGSVLQALFSSSLIEKSGEENGRCFVTLREEGKDATLRNFRLFDLSKDAVIIKLDDSGVPHGLFSGDKGECRRCDYVVFTSLQGKKLMLFVELKSTKIDKSDVIKQFKSSECIMDYCNSVSNIFYARQKLFDEYEKRFVLFHKVRLAKRPTIASSPVIRGRTAEKFGKFPNPINPSIAKLFSR